MAQTSNTHQTKVLFVIGSLDVGGTEKQLVALSKGLANRGFKCSVFTLNGKGKLRESYVISGISVISAWYDGKLKRRPWRTAIAQLKLIHFVRRFRPHIIHSFLPLVTFMGSLAGVVCGCSKIVISKRGLGKHQDRVPVLRYFDLMANRLSHGILVNSEMVKKDLIERDRVNKHKIVTIYNGITVDPVIGSADKTLPAITVVTMVANLIPYKGHEDLLEAIAIVARQEKRVRFKFVGDDRGIKGRLQKMAAILEISSYVEFCGYSDDVGTILRQTHIGVLSSHEEGFSNAILEYMANGLPVVATDVGGNAEAVIDGYNGWLCPAKNPSCLADKLLDLIKDPEKAKNWGIRSRKIVLERFTMDKMIESHIRFYHDDLSYLALKNVP
jgi:glycosyltransferase involved in cell wall biosynthesis